MALRRWAHPCTLRGGGRQDEIAFLEQYITILQNDKLETQERPVADQQELKELKERKAMLQQRIQEPHTDLA